MKLLALIGLLVLPTAFADSHVIDFHIAAGTGKGAWNSKETMILVKMGQVIRFYNDDSVEHQLHTFGAPCEHGPIIAPGTSWDCVATETLDIEIEGPLYDHNFGKKAEVWISAVN